MSIPEWVFGGFSTSTTNDKRIREWVLNFSDPAALNLRAKIATIFSVSTGSSLTHRINRVAPVTEQFSWAGS